MQSNSKKSMDQIRNTMVQHEELFKEQVLALHKLYHIQKSAMQEIRRRVYSQAQVLELNSDRVILKDDCYCGSVLEGKPLRPVYAFGRAYKEESLALSLHPFHTFKELKGCGSLWMNDIGVETFHAAQSKPVRNFDLEKLPEDYVDESEIQAEPNNSGMSDAKSILSQGTGNMDEINLSLTQADSQNLKQIYPETDSKIPTVLCQEINQTYDQASEGKFFEIDVNITCSQNSNSTADKNISREYAQKNLPGVENSDIYPDVSSSTNWHMEKPILLHQGSSIFMTQLNPVKLGELHLDRNSKQGERSIFSGSTELHQDLGSDSSVTTTRPKPEQFNCCISRDSIPKNPDICTQGSSIPEDLQYEAEGHNNVFIQKSLSLESNLVSEKQNLHLSASTSRTIVDGNNDNPMDSSNTSNNIHPQDANTCKNTSFHTEDAPELGDRCSKENEEGKSALHEACESIAAEILLSFAPCKSQDDSQLQGSPIKPESGKPAGDNAGLNKKWNLRERRYAKYSYDVDINESIKWEKSVNRRTSRRPR